jgi:hypothetical protein
LKHSIPGLRMLVMIWAVGSLAMRMEAGDFHGLTLNCCLPSRRLAGALEERSLRGQNGITAGAANLKAF